GSGPVAVGRCDEPGQVEFWGHMSVVSLSIRVRGGNVDSAAFSPDGTMIAVCTGETIHIRDAMAPDAGRKFTLTGNGDRPSSVAFSPDVTQVAAARRDGLVTFWDINTLSQRTGWRSRAKQLGPVARVQNASAVGGLAFSPDGAMLAVAGDDGTVTIWGISRG